VRLVVDTNRIIAATLRDSFSRRVLFCSKFEFITPKFAYLEVIRHRQELLEKSGLSSINFDLALNSILSHVRQVDDVDMVPFFEPAKRIMASIDFSDSLFIALALSIENDGIWTEDRHFRMQSAVRIWSTAELLTLL
jgi:predicted nucleic acid-binding protein